MAGKYAHVIGKLPKDAPAGDPGHRSRVEARKRTITGAEPGKPPTAADLLRAYAAARREKARVAGEASEAEVEVDALEELLFAALEGEGLSSLKLADGSAAVDASREPTAKVVDQPRMVAWLKENGYENVLTAHANTVGSIAKELLLEGGEAKVDDEGNLTVMGGSVRLASRPKITFRGAK